MFLKNTLGNGGVIKRNLGIFLAKTVTPPSPSQPHSTTISVNTQVNFGSFYACAHVNGSH